MVHNMKHPFNKIAALLLGMTLILCGSLVAQSTGWTPPPMDEWFDQGIGPIISALIVVGGYLSKWIPGLNAIKDATYRVLAFAILIGAGFLYFGADIWQVAISYFMSTSMYELVLAQIFGKSPKVDSAPKF